MDNVLRPVTFSPEERDYFRALAERTRRKTALFDERQAKRARLRESREADANRMHVVGMLEMKFSRLHDGEWKRAVSTMVLETSKRQRSIKELVVRRASDGREMDAEAFSFAKTQPFFLLVVEPWLHGALDTSELDDAFAAYAEEITFTPPADKDLTPKKGKNP
jgi:hypothetical protein